MAASIKTLADTTRQLLGISFPACCIITDLKYYIRDERKLKHLKSIAPSSFVLEVTRNSVRKDA